MAIIYFPSGTKIIERNTASGSHIVEVLNVLPHNIFWFDDFGNFTSSILDFTASWAITASYALNQPVSLNAVSASWASQSFSSSYSLNASSASYLISASYALNAKSSSHAVSLATGIYNITSSWANNVISSSYALNASSASYLISASYAKSSSYTITASHALTSLTAAYANGGPDSFITYTLDNQTSSDWVTIGTLSDPLSNGQTMFINGDFMNTGTGNYSAVGLIGIITKATNSYTVQFETTKYSVGTGFIYSQPRHLVSGTDILIQGFNSSGNNSNWKWKGLINIVTTG